ACGVISVCLFYLPPSCFCFCGCAYVLLLAYWYSATVLLATVCFFLLLFSLLPVLGSVPRLLLADPRGLDRGGPLVRPGAGRKAGDGDEGGRVGPRSQTIRRPFSDYRKSELFSPMISCWPFGSRPSAERIVA